MRALSFRSDGSGPGAAIVLAVVCGAGLLGIGAWLSPLDEGYRALERGDLEQALQRFAEAERRFDAVPPSKQLLRADYAASVANQLRVLYRMEDHDALLEKAAASPSLAPAHFWAGCALFVQAAGEEEAEARIGWLSRASEEFRLSLELAPDDWDAKYDYELSERLLALLRDEPDKPPPELLQLLRPKPEPGQQPPARIG